MQLKNIKNKALTLTELMVVVTLVGSMAVFIIPNFSKATQKANEKAAANSLMILYANQKIRFNSQGSYVACSTDALLSSNLNFTPLSDGFTYRCTLPTGTTFKCTAAATGYTLMITDAKASVCGDTGSFLMTAKLGSGLCP